MALKRWVKPQQPHSNARPTSSGVATQADQTLTFKTRPAFKADLTCERADAEAGCLPFLPVAVTFSSPVDWKFAKDAAGSGAA